MRLTAKEKECLEGLLQQESNNTEDPDWRIYASILDKLQKEKKLVFTLCKRVTDPPEKPEHAWTETKCLICKCKLRLTNRTANGLNKMGVEVKPLCFECAKRGPDKVMENL